MLLPRKGMTGEGSGTVLLLLLGGRVSVSHVISALALAIVNNSTTDGVTSYIG